jgi:hypothetical protein
MASSYRAFHCPVAADSYVAGATLGSARTTRDERFPLTGGAGLEEAGGGGSEMPRGAAAVRAAGAGFSTIRIGAGCAMSSAVAAAAGALAGSLADTETRPLAALVFAGAAAAADPAG